MDGQGRMTRAIRLQVRLVERFMEHQRRLGREGKPEEFLRRFAAKFRMKFEARKYDRKYTEV